MIDGGSVGRLRLPGAGPVAELSWPDRLRLLVGAGLLAVALAAMFAVVAVPAPLLGVAGPGRVETTLAAMAAIAVLQGATIAALARHRSGETATPPDPTTVSSPAPTVEATLVDAFEAGDERDQGEPQRDLRRTAVRVLERHTERDHEAARSAIATGEWTDDPLAAAHLADPGAVFVPPRWRLREWIASERRAAFRAERVTDELWRIAVEGEGSA